MNTKSIIAGVLAGVTMFFLGWLIYGILFADTMASYAGSAKDAMRPMAEINFPFLAVANLVGGLFLAYVFSNWAKIFTFSGGVKAGAIIALFTVISFDFGMYATTNLMMLPGIGLDIVLNTVISAVAGGVAGWWLGRP